MPSVCTIRRASISERISASRRPSLVVSIHIATAVCVQLISEVRIGTGVCWDGQHGCDDQIFGEPCYVHESTFSTDDLLLERTTTARIGYLVYAGDGL